jgi:hypothetical protein
MSLTVLVVVFGLLCVMGVMGSSVGLIIGIYNPVMRARAFRGLCFSVLGLGLVGLYAFFR